MSTSKCYPSNTKKYDTTSIRLITLSHFRSFHPDFLLVRQNVKDASEDYRNLLLGFQYGGIPSINSLQSIYNFQVGTIILKVSSNSRNNNLYIVFTCKLIWLICIQDKPWVYGHMIQVQRKLGKDTFPLVNQSYYPNHFELVRKKIHLHFIFQFIFHNWIN